MWQFQFHPGEVCSGDKKGALGAFFIVDTRLRNAPALAATRAAETAH